MAISNLRQACVFACTLTALPFTVQASTAVFAESQHLYISQAFAIRQILNDLQGNTPDQGWYSAGHSFSQIGFEYHRWTLALASRQDYHIKHHPDTSELLYAYKNRHPINDEQRRTVYLEARSVQAEGVTMAYRQPLGRGLTTELRVGVWRGDRALDGSAEGHLQTAQDLPSGQLALDYRYSKDALLERPFRAQAGSGLSLDVQMQWAPSPNWEMNWRIDDVFTRFSWDGLGQTQVQADSNLLRYDEQGRLRSRPLLAGRESDVSHSWRLPTRHRVSVLWHRGDWSWQGRYQTLGAIRRYEIGVYKRVQQTQWHLAYAQQPAAFTLGLTRPTWQAAITTQTANLSRSQVLGLDLSWTYTF